MNQKRSSLPPQRGLKVALFCLIQGIGLVLNCSSLGELIQEVDLLVYSVQNKVSFYPCYNKGDMLAFYRGYQVSPPLQLPCASRLV